LQGPDRVQRCAEILHALEQERARLSTCTTDRECGKPVPAHQTCGCTHNPVVRLDADEAQYSALLAEVAAYRDVPACAQIAGTCDCPEMDGFMCTDGRCGWKPLDRSTLCDRTVNKYVGVRRRKCAAPTQSECAATLTLSAGTAVLAHTGATLRGGFQCHDGVIRMEGEIAADAHISSDGSVAVLDDLFKPAPGAIPEPQPAPVEHAGSQSMFMPPSGDINCVYTAAGGTAVYIPSSGGPELSCDRAGSGSYDRVVLGPKGSAHLVRHPRDASCCGVEPILPEGGHLVRGPFTCEQTAGELACKRDDGAGFAISSRRTRVLPH
jgi:hypothetical protein